LKKQIRIETWIKMSFWVSSRLVQASCCFLVLVLNFFQNLEPMVQVVGNGQNDPTPMIAPILFRMNSSSSQLLDMLQALRLGQFFFFSSLISRLPIKKIYSIAQTFQTLITYLHPIKNPKPRCHSRAKTMLQKMLKWCCKKRSSKK